MQTFFNFFTKKGSNSKNMCYNVITGKKPDEKMERDND